MIDKSQIALLPRNDDEALVIFSSLGFLINDWPFLQKNGPKNVLSSLLVEQNIKKNQQHIQYLLKFFLDFRSSLDIFYENRGFLLTPSSNNPVFSSKEAPLVFFGRGPKENLQHRPAVAIVGSRKANPDACSWTLQFARELANHKILIISGGAHGIDHHAHQGADGLTIAILGMPADLNNDERSSLIKNLSSKEITSIAPFGPWQPAQKYMFVKRNQFVVSMADALVVVQGMAGSGTLHTVRFALDLKKPIFAVPGALSDPLAFVPNQLLAKGFAKALLSHEEILPSLVRDLIKSPKKQEKATDSKPLPKLLQLLKDHDQALTIDELMFFSGCSLKDVQNQMCEYEIEGLVKRKGAQFVLLGN